MRHIRPATALLGAMLFAAVGLQPFAAPVRADPVNSFYSPPAKLPDGDGALVRTASMTVLTNIPGANGPWPGTAQRVMYTSRLQDGTPTAVTGTYIAPSRPWTGRGAQPTIVIGPGTIGQGDQCAPSKNFPLGFQVTPQPALALPISFSMNYEILVANAWNARGARVFMTDYIGLGTPGEHTYVNRAESAQAILDGARAANRLSGTGSATPIAIFGYSQGGGAAAAAAELAGTYAPDLNVRATYAGAPPADLTKVLPQIDGTLLGGEVGTATNGFAARYPAIKEIIDRRVTPRGKEVLKEISSSCLVDIVLQHPFFRSSSITRDGRSLMENIRDEPAALKVLDAQRIGRLKPTAPTLIVNGRNDDVIPYGQAVQLARDWCRLGADVTFMTDEFPPVLPGTVINHAVPMLLDSYRAGGAIDYVTDRLNGVPVKGCSIR